MTKNGSIRTIAILGAGNGGCAAAADFTQRGFSVCLYSRNLQTLAPLRERGGVEYEGALGGGFAAVPVITTHVAEAMAGADLVVIMVPTHAQEAVASVAVPHLRADQLLLVSPGHTVLLIPELLRRHGVRRPRHCETGTLPYICRMSGPARIRVTKASQHIVFGVFPAAETEVVAARVRPVLPAIRPAANILETVFPYTNAIHHPPAVICNTGRIEATAGDFYHYYEGITPSVGRLIDALDQERLAVAAALGTKVDRFVDYFCKAGYTTPAARDTGLAYEAFHQSEPDRWIRAPRSLDHRFLDEDIPYGLVPLAELGRLAGVLTPMMDDLIHVASVATGKDYRSVGLTLAKMGLAGLTPDQVHELLHEGYRD
jgi:opine dehydrogenase